MHFHPTRFHPIRLRPSRTVLRYLLVALLPVFLSSCAMLAQEELPLAEKLATLQAAHKYGAAARLIDNADPEQISSEQRSSWKQANEAAAKNYEAETIQQVGKLRKDGQWGEAIGLYRNALAAFPESTRLDKAERELLQARDEFVRERLLQHRLLRARRIPSERESLERIDDALPNSEHADSLAALNEEADRVAEALLAEGQQLLAKKQWRSAQRVLSLSEALRADERTSTALRVAKSNIKPKRKRSRPRPKPAPLPEPVEQPVDQQALAAALLDYRNALQARDLFKAREHLRTAAALSPEDETVRGENTRLQALIDSSVESRVEQGKYQYSLGDIDKAIEHWEFAYRLKPDDESLKERLEKARRFRDRYEQLKR